MKNKTESIINVSLSTNNRNLNDIVILQHYFEFFVANIIRSKTSFTLVFVSSNTINEYGVDCSKQALQEANLFLLQQTRSSDRLFQLPTENEWVFLLPQSTTEDAKYFLKRIFQIVPNVLIDSGEERQLQLSASIVEISQSKISFEEALYAGKEALYQALKNGPFSMQIVETYSEREVEKVKVSIIEDNNMMQNVLQTLLQRTAMDYFDLEIQTFDDGEQFLQSTWYQSGHTHIVMINDVLPKKSGVEVLHELRSMPNTMKYIIFMLSKGKTEEDMMYAYDIGVDEFILKPFNVKLVEAQIKRWLKRLR